MQLKVKGMQVKARQLKVPMKNNIGKEDQEGTPYMVSLPFSLEVSFPLLLSFIGEKTISHIGIGKTPFLLVESFLSKGDLSYSYLTHCNMILII